MTIRDLSNYNLGELKGLQFDIEKEIKGRHQQDVKKAREQILAVAQSLGVSVEELVAGAASKAKGQAGTRTVAPRYRNPANDTEMWTGRGRQPRWIVAALAAGKTLDDLKI